MGTRYGTAVLGETFHRIVTSVTPARSPRLVGWRGSQIPNTPIANDPPMWIRESAGGEP
jgi:hypothetical protein